MKLNKTNYAAEKKEARASSRSNSGYIMAFRFVLAKVGNLCVKSGRRRLVENKSHRIWDDEEYQNLLKWRSETRRMSSDGIRSCCRPLRSDYYLPYAKPADDPDIMASAHLAVEVFNKQKNAQLQYLRAVKAYRQYAWWGNTYYYLTLEAIDEAEVVKTYQAIVLDNEDCPNQELQVFGQVANDGSRNLVILFVNPDRVVFRGCHSCDKRDDRSVKGEISSTREIEVALQTREGYVLDDEILGSLQALPL